MKFSLACLPVVCLSAFLVNLSMDSESVVGADNQAADKAETDMDGMKLFLMIGKPSDETWATIVKGEVDMSIEGRKGIEAMGGKMLGFYIGVGESRNYAIVAFPDSVDVAKLVYARALQGVMDELQFIEIMTTEKAAEVFKMINAKPIGGNT